MRVGASEAIAPEEVGLERLSRKNLTRRMPEKAASHRTRDMSLRLSFSLRVSSMADDTNLQKE
jgi:hypothetical protein